MKPGRGLFQRAAENTKLFLRLLCSSRKCSLIQCSPKSLRRLHNCHAVRRRCLCYSHTSCLNSLIHSPSAITVYSIAIRSNCIRQKPPIRIEIIAFFRSITISVNPMPAVFCSRHRFKISKNSLLYHFIQKYALQRIFCRAHFIFPIRLSAVSGYQPWLV